MKKVNDCYIPSVTELKRERAHARAQQRLAERHGNHFELWFNTYHGIFRLYELTGSSYMVGEEQEFYINFAPDGYIPNPKNGRDMSEHAYCTLVRDEIVRFAEKN